MDELDPNTLEALEGVLARLKHDLGKYVSLQQRWLPDRTDEAALLEALRADLLHTRRGPDGSMSAVAVWQEFEPLLCGDVPLPDGQTVDLSAEPLVLALQADMGIIEEVAEALSEEDVSETRLLRGADAAIRISEGVRALLREVRQTRRGD